MDTLIQQAIDNFDLSDILLTSVLVVQSIVLLFAMRIKVVFRRKAEWY